MKIIGILGAALVSVIGSAAGTYTIDWHKIAGGGGTSTGAVYAVSGTIGQPEAGSAMTNGQYSVTGGFWSLVQAVQTTGLPLLSISHAGNSVTVSWADTGNCSLEQNSDVANTGGWTASGYQVVTANGTNRITINPPAGRLFFRLKQ